MKEIVGFLLVFGFAVMTAGVVLAYTAYGHSDAMVQWIHHPFATGVFGVGLLAVYLGMLGWMDVENSKN